MQVAAHQGHSKAEAETEVENKEEWGCVRYPYGISEGVQRRIKQTHEWLLCCWRSRDGCGCRYRCMAARCGCGSSVSRGCGGRDTYENDGGCMTRHSRAVMHTGMRLCKAWLQRRDTEGVRERRAASIVRVRKWWRQTCRNAGRRGARQRHGGETMSGGYGAWGSARCDTQTVGVQRRIQRPRIPRIEGGGTRQMQARWLQYRGEEKKESRVR
ncbi:hypothetical protein BDZ89DRAFT_139 [Hymenopellis radicata]|nr:hypothetical protein BDZ89DRAFT_139 [Hymenopellis radicata]